jgi:hypothetical protein
LARAKKQHKQKSPTAEKNSDLAVIERRHPLALRRVRVLIVLAVVAVLGGIAREAWRRTAPIVANRDRYLLSAEAITITQPPEWIVASVREQVIHAAGLDRRLSILDPAFVESIQRAFELHPWVQSVDRIEKKFPPAVKVELTYRRPVAVIEIPAGDSRALLPVDLSGINLPAEDVPLIRRQYLPRITGIAGQPPVGQRWEDPRALGAVELAAGLGDLWEPLHLMEICPSARTELQGDRQLYVYDIVTRGGTKIIWGASPRAQAPGEARFTIKVERLKQCVQQYGPLDSVKAPGTVDVRGELRVEPRVVKKEESGAPETVVK